MDALHDLGWLAQRGGSCTLSTPLGKMLSMPPPQGDYWSLSSLRPIPQADRGRLSLVLIITMLLAAVAGFLIIIISATTGLGDRCRRLDRRLLPSLSLSYLSVSLPDDSLSLHSLLSRPTGSQSNSGRPTHYIGATVNLIVLTAGVTTFYSQAICFTFDFGEEPHRIKPPT